MYRESLYEKEEIAEPYEQPLTTRTVSDHYNKIPESNLAEWTLKKDEYNYNRLKVFLIEAEEGDISGYEAHLNRFGIIGRPEVEVLKF